MFVFFSLSGKGPFVFNVFPPKSQLLWVPGLFLQVPAALSVHPCLWAPPRSRALCLCTPPVSSELGAHLGPWALLFLLSAEVLEDVFESLFILFHHPSFPKRQA